MGNNSFSLPSVQAIFQPALFLLLLFVSLLPEQSRAEYQLLDRIVAIAEDDIVLASQLRDDLAMYKKQITARGGNLPPDNILFEQVLERAILESLQLQRAARIGMRISDQDLNETMTQMAARNGLSLPQFKNSIEQQGDSYLEIRENIRRDLLIREVQRRSVIRSINVSESEIDNFLLSMIQASRSRF